MKRFEPSCKCLSAAVSAAVVVSLTAGACSNSATDKSGATATSKATTQTATDQTATKTTADAAKPGTAGGAKPDALSHGKSVGIATGDVEPLPQIVEAQNKLDLDKMPDNLVICTVGTVPIDLGLYRRERRLELAQVRSQMSMDDGLLQQLLLDANRDHVTLTGDEKKRLVETTHRAQGATGGVLDGYLKEHHLTIQQFDQHVLDLGLATKALEFEIDHRLLTDLVDRELICSAALSSGFGPAAFNKYTQLKASPQYQSMLKSGLMSEDQFKDETIKSELMRLEMQKIQEATPVTDQQIKAYYDKNVSKFKHGDRIRWSQIVLSAGGQNGLGSESLRDQLKKKNPSISDADLDAQIKLADQEAKKKADDLLARAMKGEDFAQLANQYTEVIPSRAAKNGGDMGYTQKDALQKDFADKFWNLKPGQVYPAVIPSDGVYVIVKVTDKQGPGTIPLAEVKDVLKQLLVQNDQLLALTSWLSEKRKTVPITLSPDFQKLVAADDKSQKTAAPSAPGR